MTKKVCISGYYGFDNFGDEIILKILTENLKKFDSPPEITVFSVNPEKTSLKNEVKSVYTFSLNEVVKSLACCDYLISGGGSLLQDVTSSKSLIYYLFVIFTALCFRKKVIIFAQGIGPINNKILAKLTIFLLKKSELITIRDNSSLNLLKKSGINNARICVDPVWNLKLSKLGKTGKIGVQLRNYPDVNDTFIGNLAYCINKYYQNKEINIISFQNDIDLKVCNKLKSRLENINPDLNIKITENTSDEQIINDICSLDELIAMRYHACLTAIKADVKLLPVSYDIKVENLSKEFKLNYINLSEIDKIEEIIREFRNKEIKYDKNKINSLNFDFKQIEETINK